MDALRGICRHCGEKVKFHLLPRTPEQQERRSGTYYTWFHLDLPVGSQIQCVGRQGVRERAAPREYCAELIHDGSYLSNYCNRKVKDPDLFMCGIHARQVKKQEEKSRQWDEDREISGYIFTETVALQQRLQERFGVDSKTHYDHLNHKYTGMIIVNPAELCSFLEEIFDA